MNALWCLGMGHIPRQTSSGRLSRKRRPSGSVQGPRRALSNVGGNISVDAGCAEDRELLLRALGVHADDPYVAAHLHGFHAYPARLHPRTARHLIEGLTQPGQSVLDPFCGSGTVLLEARIMGRASVGLDANPLAVALTSLKLTMVQPAERQRLLKQANAVLEMAESRRLSRAGPSRRYPAGDAALFDPHVLLELDGLHWGIGQITDPFGRNALMLVLSSMLNKVSRRTSDTSAGPSRQKWASGFVIKFFGRKVHELVARQVDFDRLLPKRTECKSDVRLGDARSLPFSNASVSAVITSPPYPGIYDYVDHHRIRLKWLGLDAQHLERHEMGAKRHSLGRDARTFRKSFNLQLQQCLAEMARVLDPSGTVALVIADSVVGHTPWYADEEIHRVVSPVGLKLVAQASQVRPHFHEATGDAFAHRPRCERLLLLRHGPMASSEVPNAVHMSSQRKSNVFGRGSKGPA
jgi:DNA modification methylase